MSMHEINGESKDADVVELTHNTEDRTMAIPQISVRYNNTCAKSQCSLCGDVFKPDIGWWPFLTERVVCLDCASQHPVRLPPDPGCYAKVLSAIPANTSIVDHWDGEPYALVRFDHGNVIVETLNPCVPDDQMAPDEFCRDLEAAVCALTYNNPRACPNAATHARAGLARVIQDAVKALRRMDEPASAPIQSGPKPAWMVPDAQGRAEQPRTAIQPRAKPAKPVLVKG